MSDSQTKVTAEHLRRDAYLYVRQSSLHQVVNNTESGRRQYDLRGRAVALGWPAERVVVIDVDQGQSGSSATDREGFQRLVADVSLQKAGIVLGLECSRLARNNADWHRLLELCALSGTLICDEDGLYDPATINDRLLLGLKGTISEAELHFIRARLQGGLLAKARRGELAVRLPVGLVYDPLGNVVLDPDAGVREAIAHLFETFEATGSASAVVKAFAAEHLTFPGRHSPGGPHAGELYHKPLRHDQALFVLHNPRYAGAYFYGRRKQLTDINGHTRTMHKPRDQWTVLIKDAHPGYITFEQYETNQATLTANAAARGEDRRAGPAREGPALLQGLVICGKCGKRMTVNYHARCNGELLPDYHCKREGITTGTPPCQTICGTGIDKALATLVLEQLTPLAIETALHVSAELTQRAADADQIRASSVQRAQHAADTARRRYLAVDPTNRLVADTLEADWNHKLRELSDTQDEYQRARNAGTGTLTDEQQARIRALASDLPALFNNPATPIRERKRLIRLLITDVTLIRGDEQITAHVRLSGGPAHTLTVPRPLRAWEAHTTPASTITLIDELLNDHTYDETVTILNQQRLTGGWGHPFTVTSLTQLCRNRGIPSHHERLRAAGMLTLDQIAKELSVSTQTVKVWQRRGDITGRRIDGRRAHLYHPGQTRPPDRRRRHRQPAVLATDHHQLDPAPEGITTTNSPGGAV
ncbi:MAG: recombinase family protein [Gemmatimonadaceae bacterium]|nr:recombinase family protein [Gemmatimonadaceae bacterium]